MRPPSNKAILNRISAVMNPGQLINAQKEALKTHTSDAIYDYTQRILSFSRSSERFHQGLSPRSGIGLLNAAKAWAYINGRDLVLPEDIQEVLPYVAGHRLQSGRDNDVGDGKSLVSYLIESVPVT